MPGADYEIRQGDSPARLTATLLDANGDPVNLTGATVRIQLLPLGEASFLIDAEAENLDVSAETRGNVAYDLTDTDEAMFLLGTWVVTFAGGGGAVLSYPNGEYFGVNIFPDVPATDSPFTTSSDLAARLGLDFTAAEHVRANSLLILASNIIRARFGQTISLVSGDTVTLHANGSSRLALPQRPVGDIISVTRNGTLIDADSYWVDGSYLVYGFGYGMSEHSFGTFRDTVEIVYDHGYSTIPGDIVAVTLEMVRRVWTNPAALVSETVGSVQSTYSVAPVPGLLLTPEEEAAIGAVLLGTAGTIQLR